MFGKTNASELPLPVSKAQPYLELFTLRFVWRQVGVKARYPVFRMPHTCHALRHEGPEKGATSLEILAPSLTEPLFRKSSKVSALRN
jgi:hypothetical protein